MYCNEYNCLKLAMPNHKYCQEHRPRDPEPEPTEAAPSHVCGLEGYGHLDDPPCPACEVGRMEPETPRPEMGINWQDLYQRTEDFLYAIREEFNIRPYKTNAIDHCTVIRLFLRGKLAAASGTESAPGLIEQLRAMSRTELEETALTLHSLKEMWAKSAKSNEVVRLMEENLLLKSQPSSLTQARPVRKPLPKGWWGWNAKGEPIEKCPYGPNGMESDIGL